MDRHDRVPDDDLGASGLLCRLHMLLHLAVASAPGDTSVLKLAMIQAAAATGADSAVLGTVNDRDVVDVSMLSAAGGPVHDAGALAVSPQYPLTDVIVRAKPIWLASPPEVRAAYPTGGALWGRAFAGVPLLAGGAAIGAIGLIHDTTGHHFTDVERTFVSAVADLCAGVLFQAPAGTWPRQRNARVTEA
ncbi:GAF domain-containing protein [Actinoplanes sp. NPDC049548]|uniref:GAF domain-containing protein n=1 Tax=Actinoplanes sp. NPDC049548 TaxID=3155152 RepID=UPI003418BC71